MCIIIYQPKGKLVSQDHLVEAWKTNDDGGGYMFCHRGTLHIRKGFVKYAAFYEKFEEDVLKFPNSDFAIHFRIGTSGLLDTVNTHPHVVHTGLAFMHNGIIGQLNGKDPMKSDTVLFNEKYLAKLPANFYKNKAIMELIEDFVSTDKLLFMDNLGKVVIVNEAYGSWVEGIWYSNSSYKNYSTGVGFNSYGGTYGAEHSRGYLPVTTEAGSSNITTANDETDIIFPDEEGDVEYETCFQCSAALAEDEERTSGYCIECLVLFGYYDQDPRELLEQEEDLDSTITASDQDRLAIEDYASRVNDGQDGLGVNDLWDD